VDGQVIDSDGKTENAQHVLAFDPFTLAALEAYVEQLDQERRELGPDYQDHGVLFCWEDGEPPHPDTITRRFTQFAAVAGLPEVDLHDVGHSYATAGRDARIDWKALSKRIGHADLAFTMKQYVQTDLEADRQVANTLAELIIGGSLVSNRSRPGRHQRSGRHHALLGRRTGPDRGGAGRYDLDGPFPVEPPLTLARIRETGQPMHGDLELQVELGEQVETLHVGKDRVMRPSGSPVLDLPRSTTTRDAASWLRSRRRSTSEILHRLALLRRARLYR
jgi:hypothetical protein